MNLLDVVREVRRHLEENGRLSLRMLRRQFELDDDALEEVIEELVDVQRVARREENALAWSAATPPVGTPPPARDPRAYTPKHLAEKILTSRCALEGERKQVTVLFADVKGSMELAEQVDPEEWHGIMDRFFAILAEGVHRFEGTVNQYTGDGIMALFGAPIAHEDHAQRACYAALHLREELRRYADELRREHGLNFSVRMGLNSGEVVVGKIGDDLRMDYTAQGHTVGLAARMEQLADAGKVLPDRAHGEARLGLLPAPRSRAVRDQGGARAGARLRARGRGPDAHAPRRLARARLLQVRRPRRARWPLSRRRSSGRSRATRRSSAWSPSAGTGKSRLCYEFAERCRAREIPVYEGHGVAHGKAIPLLPVLEFLRSYFGITEHDTARAARDKIAGRMLLLDETLAEGLPLMFDFLGVPDPERPAPPLGPEARQRQLFDVMRRLARARSAREPAVDLFEDLHWFDRASEAFLENARRDRARQPRRSLLLNFRPEYHAAWMQRSYYQQLPLLPLGPEAIEELFADLLGSDPSLQRLRELIQERTGGNPFFIEEIVQSLVETGVVAGARGAYRLVTPVEEVGRARDRAERARGADRPLARAREETAADGGGHRQEVLRADSPARGRARRRRAFRCSPCSDEREFLYQEALYPEAEYSFKHPLTQEVAYRSQLAERRARVHARGRARDRGSRLGEARRACGAPRLPLGACGRRSGSGEVASAGGRVGGAQQSCRGAAALGERAAAPGHAPGDAGEPRRESSRARPDHESPRSYRAIWRTRQPRFSEKARELATRSGDPHVLSQVLNGFGYLRLLRRGRHRGPGPAPRVDSARRRGDETTHQRELREAHRLFLEIGAPIRAEQVATQLRP